MSGRHPFAIAAASVISIVALLVSAPNLLAEDDLEDVLDRLDVPYVPTRQNVVDEMLTLAGVRPDDVLYDLGAGDGRIVITAVRDFKAGKGVGVDLDPRRVTESNANAAKAGVTDRVAFHEGDVFEFDFSEASVLTMFLLPEVNLRLRPRILSSLQPGTRVVSHLFDMGDWKPDRMVTVDGTNEIYFWTVPADVGGIWEWTANGTPYKMELRQTFQAVMVVLQAAGERYPVQSVTLTGDRIKIEATTARGEAGRPFRIEATFKGDAMTGTQSGAGGGAISAQRAARP